MRVLTALGRLCLSLGKLIWLVLKKFSRLAIALIVIIGVAYPLFTQQWWILIIAGKAILALGAGILVLKALGGFIKWATKP